MTELHQFILGSGVLGRDRLCGTLRAVVIDPASCTVTHLIVGPRHRHHGGQLVPIGLVGSTRHATRLVCTRAEFADLTDAEWTQSVPALSAGWGYDRARAGSYSAYAVGIGRLGMGDIAGRSRQTVIRSRVPAGEDTLCVGERARAMDGAIGRVHGIVARPTDHRLTHVLVEWHQLQARHRVAVPVESVTGWHHGVRFGLTKAEVRTLSHSDAPLSV